VTHGWPIGVPCQAATPSWPPWRACQQRWKNPHRKLLDQNATRRARARVRRRSDADGDIPAQLRAIYAEQKTLRARMRERRVAAKEAAKPLIEAAEAARRQRVKDAVAEAGLWWGHSETVLAKYDVARVRAMKEGAELRFRRFEGEGSMGVRFTKDGGALQKIQAGTTDLLRFREATPEELGHMKAIKGRRRKAPRVSRPRWLQRRRQVGACAGVPGHHARRHGSAR
jgi:hypothetical protein